MSNHLRAIDVPSRLRYLTVLTIMEERCVPVALEFFLRVWEFYYNAPYVHAEDRDVLYNMESIVNNRGMVVSNPIFGSQSHADDSTSTFSKFQRSLSELDLTFWNSFLLKGKFWMTAATAQKVRPGVYPEGMELHLVQERVQRLAKARNELKHTNKLELSEAQYSGYCTVLTNFFMYMSFATPPEDVLALIKRTDIAKDNADRQNEAAMQNVNSELTAQLDLRKKELVEVHQKYAAKEAVWIRKIAKRNEKLLTLNGEKEDLDRQRSQLLDAVASLQVQSVKRKRATTQEREQTRAKIEDLEARLTKIHLAFSAKSTQIDEECNARQQDEVVQTKEMRENMAELTASTIRIQEQLTIALDEKRDIEATLNAEQASKILIEAALKEEQDAKAAALDEKRLFEAALEAEQTAKERKRVAQQIYNRTYHQNNKQKNHIKNLQGEKKVLVQWKKKIKNGIYNARKKERKASSNNSA